MDEKIILLTERQYEVGRLWAMGRTDKEIAELLSISPRTAQSHVRGFYEKTGCNRHSDTFDWFTKNVWKIDISGDNSIPQSVIVYTKNALVLYQGESILEES